MPILKKHINSRSETTHEPELGACWEPVKLLPTNELKEEALKKQKHSYVYQSCLKLLCAVQVWWTCFQCLPDILIIIKAFSNDNLIGLLELGQERLINETSSQLCAEF